MSDIVTSIKMAFIEQLKNNTWLDQQTIDASIEKVLFLLMYNKYFSRTLG